MLNYAINFQYNYYRLTPDIEVINATRMLRERHGEDICFQDVADFTLAIEEERALTAEGIVASWRALPN